MSEIILLGDALRKLRNLPCESVNCCVTSPPYFGLRDYGVQGQIGLETTPEEYIAHLVEIFNEVRRILRSDGTAWINIGDCYAGSGIGRYADGHHSEGKKQATNTGSVLGCLKRTSSDGCKAKDLIGIPWMLAFALRADGWYLRQDIIWEKPNAMPESVKDRCTKSYEHIFLLAKNSRYYFDHEAIKEPRKDARNNAPVAGSFGAFGPPQSRFRGSGNLLRKQRPAPGNIHPSRFCGNIPYNGEDLRRSKRDVWSVATQGYKGSHFAVFPEKLVEPCILAGCPEGGTVLDPFTGSGTTGVVAKRLRRNFVGIELNPAYHKLATERIVAAIPPEEQLAFKEGTTP